MFIKIDNLIHVVILKEIINLPIKNYCLLIVQGKIKVL